MLKGAEEDKTKDCLGTPTLTLVGNFADPLSTPLRGTIIKDIRIWGLGGNGPLIMDLFKRVDKGSRGGLIF